MSHELGLPEPGSEAPAIPAIPPVPGSGATVRNRLLISAIGTRIHERRMQQNKSLTLLARKIGLGDQDLLRAVESGEALLPPEFWRPIAEDLGFEAGEWVLNCLRVYNEACYSALFKDMPYHMAVRALKPEDAGECEDGDCETLYWVARA